MAQNLNSGKVSATHKWACQPGEVNCEELIRNEMGSLHLHPNQRK